jgi:hypothetical protein
MGVMTFQEWCSYKKVVMGDMPAWFDYPSECRRRFDAYRIAFEDNCSVANPLDSAFSPSAEQPVDMAPIPVAMAVQTRSGPSYPATIRAAVLALLVQIILFTAPAFAGSIVIVNGDTLAAQDRSSLEAMVGPLEPGRYWVADNGEFGREGADIPIANLRLLIQQRVQAAQTPWQAHQQYTLRQQLRLTAQLLQHATRHRPAAPNGSAAEGGSGSGDRSGDGSPGKDDGDRKENADRATTRCMSAPALSHC